MESEPGSSFAKGERGVMRPQSRPRNWLPIGLWAAVLVFAAYLFWFKPAESLPVAESGVVLVDVPWEHLPDLGRFRLTDQTGVEVDSADLSGKVTAVCFFFARCPSICRDLNRQVQRMSEQLRDVPLQFLSVSVDPENDTPEVLGRYAADFGAQPERWRFLTGQLYRVKELGQQSFRVDVNPETHTDNIFLIDRWGRYRDRFKWDDPTDMKRFATVARELAVEQQPPLGQVIRTRNALAGVEPKNWDDVPWVREFFLTDQTGRKVYNRDWTGEVWIGSFFFSTCPGICPRQNAYLAGLQERLGQRAVKLVSITTDPKTDTTAVLAETAARMRAQAERWLFCRGDEQLTRRIAAEFFRAEAGTEHHTSRLFVVDRWGQVRGSFDWQQPEQEVQMLQLIDQCLGEQAPVRDFKLIRP
ncbi:MAG: SCO family protein [Planctomycetota bacterium]|jgi:cytochrome oxidase Cu insertion factor (SCO1/SenC/PrrC family)